MNTISSQLLQLQLKKLVHLWKIDSHSFQITAPLFSSRLFEYGPDAGDEELLRNLDAEKKINLIYPLKFYGVDTSTVYVSKQVLYNSWM